MSLVALTLKIALQGINPPEIKWGLVTCFRFCCLREYLQLFTSVSYKSSKARTKFISDTKKKLEEVKGEIMRALLIQRSAV